MVWELLLPEIDELIERKEFKAIKEALSSVPPADVAEILSTLSEPNRSLVFRLLPRDLATEVFEFLDVKEQEELLSAIGTEGVRSLLEEMSPDDRTYLLEELPAPVTRRLLTILSPEARQVATTLLGYPEESVGRLMTPDFIELKPEMKAAEALNHIRRIGLDKETIYSCYVTDAAHHLHGVVTLRSLVLADPEQPVAELVHEHLVSVSPTVDQEEVVELCTKYDMLAIPVVDSQKKLLGIVTIDDLMDVMSEEATEDIHLMGAILPIERTYLKIGVFSLVGKRVIWLLALLIAESIACLIIRHHARLSAGGVRQQFFTDLIAFLPVLIATAGNTGNQSSTLIIRALAVGELILADVFRVLKRELVTGLCLGIPLSVAMFIIAFFLGGNIGIAFIVGTVLTIVITLANILGALLPLFLKMLGLDPAFMSNPLISTLMDIAGLAIYFNLSLLMMPWVLKG